MLYFSKLRIVFITIFSLLFVLIASSNLFKFDDGFFNKKINLGLDLQGGSYLLLEIDNEPVIEQKLQNLTTTFRNYFKDKENFQLRIEKRNFGLNKVRYWRHGNKMIYLVPLSDGRVLTLYGNITLNSAISIAQSLNN